MKGIAIAGILSIMMSISCSKQPLNSYSSISILLTDAPAKYDEIWIDIDNVMILFSNDNVQENWIALKNFKKGRYNLLNLSNGADTLLANSDILDGTISQIRLHLGTNNTIVASGSTYNLDVPSGSSSGIKINFKDTIEPGIDKPIWIELNAEKSIINTGSGKYQLKPVLRAYTSSNTGSIKGKVNPIESIPYIFLNTGSEIISTTAAKNGAFVLSGIPVGKYTINFEPVVPYKVITLSNVVVEQGKKNNIGEIVITAN
jgi:hypothetical protein